MEGITLSRRDEEAMAKIYFYDALKVLVPLFLISTGFFVFLRYFREQPWNVLTILCVVVAAISLLLIIGTRSVKMDILHGDSKFYSTTALKITEESSSRAYCLIINTLAEPEREHKVKFEYFDDSRSCPNYQVVIKVDKHGSMSAFSPRRFEMFSHL